MIEELNLFETSLILTCVVIGQTDNFLLLINITSELSVTLHFEARYSVTPI